MNAWTDVSPFHLQHLCIDFLTYSLITLYFTSYHHMISETMTTLLICLFSLAQKWCKKKMWRMLKNGWWYSTKRAVCKKKDSSMALKGRQKIQLSCILCFQTLRFRFSTASPCPYINVDFGIHCDMRCQNAVGGFPLWKSHMDVISSISS